MDINEKVDNEVNASNDFLNVLVKNVSGIDDYIPQYANQAIHFTGDCKDKSKDSNNDIK